MTDEALTTRARDVAQKVLALSPHAYGPEWWPGRTGDEATDQIAAFGRECREAGAIAALEPANYSLGAAWKQKAEQEKARADEAVVAAERQYDQAVEATQRALQAEERADALQQLIFAKDDALLAARARVRELEEERDNSLEGWRQANNRIRSQMKRITQLEEALRGLRTMVVNVLTDSQLDHVNCGQTIRNALGPVDALLSPDDGSQL
jgi:Na+-translocating ferredoxin:NAD+ oxidoreductase RnfC subunit